MRTLVFLYTDSRKLVQHLWVGNLFEILSMVWFGISFQNIYKIIKGYNVSFETSYCKSHNLPGRLTDFGQQYEQNIYGKGLCDLPTATYRLCDKSEETCVRPCTSNRSITSGFDKTNRNLFFNNLSSAPRLSTVSLLTTATNCIYEGNTVLPQFSKADSMAMYELLWWANNLELYKGRLVIQPQAQVLTSNKGLGVIPISWNF